MACGLRPSLLAAAAHITVFGEPTPGVAVQRAAQPISVAGAAAPQVSSMSGVRWFTLGVMV